jgi:hypothetical protein
VPRLATVRMPELLVLALVSVRLEPLAVFVLAHLFATLLDYRTHSGDPHL